MNNQVDNINLIGINGLRLMQFQSIGENILKSSFKRRPFGQSFIANNEEVK